MAAGWPGDGHPIRHLAATGRPARRHRADLRSSAARARPVRDRPGRPRPASRWTGPAEAAAALRPVMSLHARPVRVADLPAGHGVSYGPTLHDDPAVAPRDAAHRLRRRLVAEPVRPRRGARPGSAGPARRDRGDGRRARRRDRRARPAGHRRRRVRAPRRPDRGRTGPPSITRRRGGAERTTITWEVVTQMARRLPRVYHAAAVPVGVRTLTEEIRLWSPESNCWNGDIVDLEVDAIVNPASHDALDVDRGRRRPQAARRRRDRVRRGAPGPGPARRRDRDDGRRARRPVRHPRGLDRHRPADERPGDRVGRPQRPRPRPRELGDQHRLPGPRDGRRRVPARRGRAPHGRPACATRCRACPPSRHVIFALRGAATYKAFEAAIAATEPGRVESAR